MIWYHRPAFYAQAQLLTLVAFMVVVWPLPAWRYVVALVLAQILMETERRYWRAKWLGSDLR